MGAVEKLKMTLEEYFALDDSQGERYEYLDGEVFPVVDTSIQHNGILSNVQGNLFNHVKGKPCKTFTSSQKVQAEINNSYCLPDIMVVCNEIKTMFNNPNIITNPVLVIEILSPTTQDYDLGGKYKLYRNIDSLTEYICIFSTENLVLKHNRKSKNIWEMIEFNALDETILLESIGLQIPMKEIFDGIIFPEKKQSGIGGMGYAIKL